MTHRLLAVTVLALAWLSAPLTWADPPGPELEGQVQQAYQQTQQYQATLTFLIQVEQGRWTTIRQADVRVAFDRPGQRLMVDHPDFYLVVADGKLRLRSDRAPGRYVETALPSPLTYEAIIQAVPVLAGPPMPDLAFLLSDHPVWAMAGQPSARATVLPPAEGGSTAPRLQIQADQGTVSLSIDPQTKLVTQAVSQLDTTAMGPVPANAVTFSMDYQVQKHNEPLDDALFAFDTQGSQAVNSLAALMSGGGGGGGGWQAHPLENQPVPPIELPTLQGQPFRLADVKAGVVVLDFWATWCPPCREGLPHIQAIHDWAKREGLSVAVYAVNVGETAREVQAFWDEQGFTMPVLMDQQTKVAGAYGVQGIPQTVVIADGKVQHVHVGYNPAMENQLKSEIQSLLSQSATPPRASSNAQ